MTKKTVGYVELEWRCPNCGARNPGTAVKCSGCGAAQPQDVVFEPPVQAELLTDEAKIAQAQAGPDIHCGFCGTRNPATAAKCRQCGAELKAGAKRQAGQVVGALPTKQAPPVTCAVCGAENPATALRCAQCGSPLAKPVAPPPQAQPAPRPFPIGLVAVAGILVLILCLAVVLFSGGDRGSNQGGITVQQVPAQVSDAYWKRAILVQALLPVQRQGWQPDIPSGATVGACQQRVYRTFDAPVPNSVEVCGTPYVVDTGTGVGEVVQDCQYQVFENYCSYTVMGWQTAAPLVLEGSGLSPAWPERPVGDQVRESGRQEEYIVTFQTANGPIRFAVPNLQQFQQFTPGSRWTLQMDERGRVLGVTAASADGD